MGYLGYKGKQAAKSLASRGGAALHNHYSRSRKDQWNREDFLPYQPGRMDAPRKEKQDISLGDLVDPAERNSAHNFYRNMLNTPDPLVHEDFDAMANRLNNEHNQLVARLQAEAVARDASIASVIPGWKPPKTEL